MKQFEDFDAKNFPRPAQIDNQWMPLKPGTRFTYAGTTIEDDGTPHGEKQPWLSTFRKSSPPRS